ncbi:hypothetical protein E4U19_007972, partial [Claviceps sp. Clav32 group G5]
MLVGEGTSTNSSGRFSGLDPIVRARDAKFDEGDFPTQLPSSDSTYVAELVDPSFEEEGRRIIDVPTAEVFVSKPKDIPHQQGASLPSPDNIAISEASKPLSSSDSPSTRPFLPSPSPTPSADSDAQH